MDEATACSRCRHWVSLWAIKKRHARAGSGEHRSRRGQCRRYAPRASPLTPQWPWTKAFDTCGDFEPLSRERRAASRAPSR